MKRGCGSDELVLVDDTGLVRWNEVSSAAKEENDKF